MDMTSKFIISAFILWYLQLDTLNNIEHNTICNTLSKSMGTDSLVKLIKLNIWLQIPYLQ